MNIRSRDDFDSAIREAWPDGEERRLSLSILVFISEHPKTFHIPYARLQEIGKEALLKDPEVVPRVVQYLTGADSHLLDVAGELFDEDDEPRVLKDDEFNLATTEGINPLTGDYDPTLPQKLFVYFRPSRLAQEVLWGAHAGR